MTKSIGILTFGQMRSRSNIGSSRIRALWLTRYWSDAELFTIGSHYSTIIFQKAYWTQFAQKFDGLKILDLCDPDFLDWRSPCLSMVNYCDAVTTSTEALASLISQYTRSPVTCIPDRIDLDEVCKYHKDHSGRGIATTAAWFGYSSNFPSLDAAIYDLASLGFKDLVVISDTEAAYTPPGAIGSDLRITTYTWDQRRAYEQLLRADVVVNYRLDYGRWKYKSNNKTVLAWALGLPVAHSKTELARFLTETERTLEAASRLSEVQANYDVRRSVKEYMVLLSSLREGSSQRESRL